MKCFYVVIFFIIFGGAWRLGRATCVLESDFGFILNCAFKKSGLFRVRNLGGVKAHIGLGFSVGDELGFKESLTNVESNRRRSSQASNLQAQLIQAQQKTKSANPVPHLITPEMIEAMKREAHSPKSMSTVPPFKPIPPAPERHSIVPTNSSKFSSSIATPALMGIAAPAFKFMPSSISRFSTGSTLDVSKSKLDASKISSTDKMSSTNFALRTLPTPNNELPPPLPQHSSNSLHALLAANNVSEEALEQVLLQRQQVISKMKLAATTTTTHHPITSKYSNSVGKVMNAPKEYYPVGYDKNFDDNFASRVELPETSFYCGDQKHFPGLYADEDLGCMVFHVCALTDDGLIMKSFLCPESTLFDQTILKCNWWFYVDCKSSRKLYDSNIPISKSYQLMKALTFFSSYRKEQSPTPKTKDKD